MNLKVLDRTLEDDPEANERVLQRVGGVSALRDKVVVDAFLVVAWVVLCLTSSADAQIATISDCATVRRCRTVTHGRCLSLGTDCFQIVGKNDTAGRLGRRALGYAELTGGSRAHLVHDYQLLGPAFFEYLLQFLRCSVEARHVVTASRISCSPVKLADQHVTAAAGQSHVGNIACVTGVHDPLVIGERFDYIAQSFIPASVAHQKSGYLDGRVLVDLARRRLRQLGAAGAIGTRRACLVTARTSGRTGAHGRR